MLMTDQDAVEQYRQLFEEAPVAYHELNTKGIVLRVSNAECIMLEYTREEMVGRHISEFVSPQEKEACLKAFSKKIQGELPEGPFYRRYRTKDGRDITVEIFDHLMRDAEGEVIGIRSALIDVTNRLAIESAVREHQQWMNSIFQSIPCAIAIVDTLGLVKQINPYAEELLGWKTSSLLGKPFLRITQTTTVPASSDGQPYSSRCGVAEPWSGISTFFTEQNEIRSLMVKTSPLLTDDDVCIGIVLSFERLKEDKQ